MLNRYVIGLGISLTLLPGITLAAEQTLTPMQQELLQQFLYRGCLKRPPSENLSPDALDQFCECASDHLAKRFSADEVLGIMNGQIKKDDPRGQARLHDATVACARYLEEEEN